MTEGRRRGRKSGWSSVDVEEKGHLKISLCLLGVERETEKGWLPPCVHNRPWVASKLTSSSKTVTFQQCLEYACSAWSQSQRAYTLMRFHFHLSPTDDYSSGLLFYSQNTVFTKDLIHCLWKFSRHGISFS